MPCCFKDVLKKPLPPILAMPEMPADMQMSLVKDSISYMFAGIEYKMPEPEDLKKIYAILLKCYSGDQGFESVGKRELRLSPWVLLVNIDPSRRRLALNRNFLEKFLEYLRLHFYPRAVLVLAYVFLRKYPRGEVYFDLLRMNLIEFVSRLDNYRGTKFCEQSEKYHFFQEDGPAVIAKDMVNSTQHPDAFLSDIGLRGGCLQEGIVEYVFEKWLANSFVILTNNKFTEYQERLQRFLDYSVKDNTFRFPKHKARLAEILLLPFETSQPEAECKEILQGFLLKNYGDPRFDLSKWVGVDNRAIKILRRWLVQDTLDDFFSLLDYVARYDRDADRQWKYRKSFWATCLRHGIISDAWVALGRTAWENSHHFLRNRNKNYGSIGGPGVMARHSVLIMEIGGMTVSEWSHSGKYRFWNSDNVKKPKLYQRDYVRSDIVEHADFEGIHYAALSGKWQGEVADYLYKHTGFRLNSREYMQI